MKKLVENFFRALNYLAIVVMVGATSFGINHFVRGESSLVSLEQNQQSGILKILPSLSKSSVKNGDDLVISVLVNGSNTITSVDATIDELGESIPLILSSGTAHVGFWTTIWRAHDLQEKRYHVRLKITDAQEQVTIDRSLSFTDPLFGNETPGDTGYPNTNLRRAGDSTVESIEGASSFAFSSAIDTTHGFAYYGDCSNEASITKVDLSTFTRVDGLNTASGEYCPGALLIDAAADFMYAFSYDDPIVITKIDLDTFTEVDTLTLDAGEAYAISAALDSVNDITYIGTEGSNYIIKVNLNTFTRVGSIDVGEIVPTLVVDSTNGYAYAAVGSSDMRIAKINLSSFTEVDSIDLVTSDEIYRVGVIDAANGYAYFGTDEAPGRVFKINIDPDETYAVDDTLTFNSGEDELAAAGIDTTNGFAYFLTENDAHLIKVNLSTFTRVGSADVDENVTGDPYSPPVLLDPAAGFAYVAIFIDDPIEIHKINVATLSEVDALTFPPNVSNTGILSGVVDVDNGYGYFGLRDSSGIAIKVDLDTLAVVSILDMSYFDPRIAFLDASRGYLYFITSTDPGGIIKIDTDTFTEVDAGTLTARYLNSGFIDIDNNIGYFTGFSTNTLSKVDLSTLNEIDTLSFSLSGHYDTSAVADFDNGFAYFGMQGTPSSIIKVNLSTFAEVGTLTLASGENNIIGAAIDTTNGFAYFGTNTSPARIVKVNLSTFTRTGALTLSTGEDTSRYLVLDENRDLLFVGLGSSPSGVVSVDTNTFTRLGAISFETGENNTLPMGYDSTTGILFSALFDDPGVIIKTSTSHVGQIFGTKVTLPETATTIDSVSFYSHAASGNVRLALYDSGKNLLWQSGSVSNTAAGDFVTVPISSGTPTTLSDTAAGSYYLAFQTNSIADIPSYLGAGSSGDGFYVPQSYASYPTSITGETSTTERYSMYATYTVGGDDEPPVTHTTSSTAAARAAAPAVPAAPGTPGLPGQPGTPGAPGGYDPTSPFGPHGGVPAAQVITQNVQRNLAYNAAGGDVQYLQQFLNHQGFSLGVSGAGAPGQETTYFGPKTLAALIKFQEFYREQILTPIGLTQGTGFFGPRTRAWITQLGF